MSEQIFHIVLLSATGVLIIACISLVVFLAGLIRNISATH